MQSEYLSIYYYNFALLSINFWFKIWVLMHFPFGDFLKNIKSSVDVRYVKRNRKNKISHFVGDK